MTYSLEPLRTELVMVTPTHARALRESAHYGRQRPINDSHVRRLATEMTEGRFVGGTPVHICVLGLGGQSFIVNGNHTLEAVIESKVTIPLSFLYTTVESEAEVATIYANHDIGRARIWADAIRASGLFGEMDASQQFVSQFASALVPIQLGFKEVVLRGTGRNASSEKLHNQARSRELRMQMMREYAHQADYFFLATHHARTKIQTMMRRAVVFAVALETFRYQPSTATEFWEGVAKDDGLRRSDPRKLLLSYLAESTANDPSKALQVRAVASAWNAYFDKREVTLLRSSLEHPFVLHGTPWGAVPQGHPAQPVDLPDVERKAAHPVMALGQVIDPRGGRHTVATLLGPDAKR